jgi:hypothetical protein
MFHWLCVGKKIRENNMSADRKHVEPQAMLHSVTQKIMGIFPFISSKRQILSDKI